MIKRFWEERMRNFAQIVVALLVNGVATQDVPGVYL